MQSPLRARFSDLPTVYIKEILQQRMFEDKSYEAHDDHKKLYDPLEKSLERDYSDQLLSDLEEARQKKRKRRDLPRTLYGSLPPQPPPPPPPAGASGAPGSEVLSLAKSAALAPQSMAWTTSDTRYESAIVSMTQELSPTGYLILDDSILDEQMSFTFSSRWKSVTRCSQIRLTGRIHKEIKSESMSTDHCLLVVFQSCIKMKVVSYPDFGLELLMPEQIWIDDVCTYDISAKYGISHWWFNRQKFNIDRHDSLSRRKRSPITHADSQCHFKNMYPSDFEDLNLLLLQGHLDHLSGSDKRMLSTAVKLWTQSLMIQQWVEEFQLDTESYQTQLNLTKPG
nr:hypothetical protein [Tanacetum cinerariifolium]